MRDELAAGCDTASGQRHLRQCDPVPERRAHLGEVSSSEVGEAGNVKFYSLYSSAG